MTSKILSMAADKITASTLVLNGTGVFRGLLLGTDGVNDPTITVYDNTEASGEELIPTTTFDSSSLGLNGVTGLNFYVSKGVYVEISCGGTVEVIPEVVDWNSARKLRYD